MRVLLTGGGSGGHIFPLISVVRNLIHKNPSIELLFIGPDKFSKSIFREENIRAKTIFAGKLRRYISPFFVFDLIKMPIGFLQAYWYTLYFMPDIVFSKGGYGSVMPVFVCWLFRIPIVIHESDSVPGLTNVILAKIARRILISFEEASKFFPVRKVLLVGNPVRSELFLNVPKDPGALLNISSKMPIVFIIGGSQGAEQINNLILLALSDILEKYEIIHQCGKQNFEKVKQGASIQLKDSMEERGRYHLYSMLNEEEMASAYNVSSVIVSRAGSGAIFEIAAAGRPGVLIPYSASAGEHQERNAHVYSAAGAAIVLEGDNLTPHILISTLDSIVSNPLKSETMSEAARRFAKPDAASKIAEEILKLAV